MKNNFLSNRHNRHRSMCQHFKPSLQPSHIPYINRHTPHFACFGNTFQQKIGQSAIQLVDWPISFFLHTLGTNTNCIYKVQKYVTTFYYKQLCIYDVQISSMFQSILIVASVALFEKNKLSIVSSTIGWFQLQKRVFKYNNKISTINELCDQNAQFAFQ